MDRLTYPDIARIFGTALISTGVGLLVFVLITITWGDPFTKLTADAAQNSLQRQFDAELPPNPELANAGLDPELTRVAAAALKRSTREGAVVGRIQIPRIHMNRFFVNGAEHADLQKGPGLYRQVRFPGSGQPVAIAGHRTTYGAPFLDIDKLRAGDPIVLTLPYGRFTYTVTRQKIITPRDWSILQYGIEERTARLRQLVARRIARGGSCLTTCEHLVLTACHPKYSAARRLAVFAKLTRVQLMQSGARGR